VFGAFGGYGLIVLKPLGSRFEPVGFSPRPETPAEAGGYTGDYPDFAGPHGKPGESLI